MIPYIYFHYFVSLGFIQDEWMDDFIHPDPSPKLDPSLRDVYRSVGVAA
jgi:hypothetical protein